MQALLHRLRRLQDTCMVYYCSELLATDKRNLPLDRTISYDLMKVSLFALYLELNNPRPHIPQRRMWHNVPLNFFTCNAATQSTSGTRGHKWTEMKNVAWSMRSDFKQDTTTSAPRPPTCVHRAGAFPSH
jgi:hypothetical protein